nr:hypothetical protein [Tanacetum cinerariifolium]
MDLLFETMYDDYIGGQPSATARTVRPAQEPQVRQTLTTSTTIADTVPTPTNSSSHATNILNTSQDADELNSQQQQVQHQGNQAHLQSTTVADNVLNALFDGNMFVNPFAIPSTSAAESSSSHNVDPSNMHTFYQPYPYKFQWTKDHPLEQVNVVISNFNHGSTFCKISMLYVPSENNEFEARSSHVATFVSAHPNLEAK